MTDKQSIERVKQDERNLESTYYKQTIQKSVPDSPYFSLANFHHQLSFMNNWEKSWDLPDCLSLSQLFSFRLLWELIALKAS